jgi:hypothetical protein
MAFSRTLNSIGALFLVVFLAAAAVVPRAGAEVIQACEGGFDGNVTYSQSSRSVILSKDACIANAVTGLRSITSFAYYLALYEGSDAPLQTSAIIIDEAESYNAVVTIDISDLLPTTSGGDAQAVTALFASPVALDPLRTYFLAFCGTGTSTLLYTLSLGREVHTLEFCYEACTSANARWQLDSSPNVARTDIVGSCPSSPSPSASPSAPPPRSPTPSPSPSPSPSASPAKGSSDRLTPGESFGARAVRFVLSLCPLLFS